MSDPKAIGFLNVAQSILKDSGELFSEYDLALSVIGWEKRSNNALHLVQGGAARDVDLIRFSSIAPEFIKLKDEIERESEDITQGRRRIHPIGSSLDFYKNSSYIEKLITGKAREFGRPITLIADISSMPKRYLLFIVGMGFRNGLLSRADFLYSEGEYRPMAGGVKSLNRGFISSGEWTSLQVPYLEAAEFAPDKRDLFVSVGAEVTGAMPIVERFEPAALRLYHVADSSKRFPPNFLSSEEQALEVLRSMPESTSANFDLIDVVGLAQDVLISRRRNTTCLAIGAKPHALAFGIAALADEAIQVVCRSPKGYLPSDVVALGPVLRFTLEDRFEPLSCWP